MKNTKKTPLSIFCLFTFFFITAQPSSWTSVGVGGGGALFSPSINPANSNEIYIGCDMTNLFHSTNQGASWQIEDFRKIQGGMFSEVQFTRDAGIRYCVNHAIKDYVSRIRPFKTDDNGAVWYPLIAPIHESGGVVQLFADYDRPSRIVLTDYDQIFFSVDGGATFTKIYNTANSTIGNNIAGVCFDGSDIYIVCGIGIYRSTDNGATWAWWTTNGLDANQIKSFTWAKQNGVLKFVCLTAQRVWPGVRHGSTYWDDMRGLYTMTNADGQWKSHRTGINMAAGDFVNNLSMARNDTSTIYAAGGSGSLFPIVMKSVNSQAWQHTFFTAQNRNVYTGWAGDRGDAPWDYGSAPQGFQVSPTNPNMVITTDMGFVHMTTDGGTTWHQLYTNPADKNPMNTTITRKKAYRSNGLENTAAWDATWLNNSTIILGGNDMGGMMSTDGGNSWNVTFILENANYRNIKHVDGKVYAATSNIHDLYQTTRIYDLQIDAGGGKIHVSTNNGTTFSVMKDFGHPVVWIETDPNDPSVMYASVLHSDTNIGGIYKTSDLQNGTAATWTKMPHPTRANGHPFNIRVLNNGDLVATFSARAPTYSSKFEATSGVFYYIKSTGTWEDRGHANMRFWTKDLIIDPSDPTQSTWYATTFQGWGDYAMQQTGGLYRTRDKGLTWARINTEFRVNSVTIHPKNPDLAYFTTESVGLFYSTNATATNPTFTQVPSYPFNHPMRVFFNPNNLKEVWVTSFGSGTMVGYDPSITILAVEILDFKGKVEKEGNFLTWELGNKQDLDNIEILKSSNGRDFTPLSKLTKNEGNFSDKNPFEKTYYQLKINGLDGKTSLSKIILIERKSKTTVKIYPSVTSSFLTIENVKSFEIVNALGQVVLRETRSSGNFQSFPNLSQLPNGFYIVKGVDTEGGVFSEKIVKN